MNPGDRALTMFCSIINVAVGGIGTLIGLMLFGMYAAFAQGKPDGTVFVPFLFCAACAMLLLAGGLFLIGAQPSWDWGLACQALAIVLGLIFFGIMCGYTGGPIFLVADVEGFFYFALPNLTVLYAIVGGAIFWWKRPAGIDVTPDEKPLKID